MRLRTAIINFAVLVLLLACQGAWYQGDESSPLFLPPAGSTLVLNEGITIPPGKTSVYLQGGRVVESFWKVNVYHPYCKFELRTLRSEGQAVARDDFVVQRVVRHTSFTPSARRDTRLASTGRFVAVQAEDSGMTLYSYLTELYLGSDRQRDVYRMACQQWDYPPMGNHVSVQDIRGALGGLFTLRLAERAKR